MLSRRNSSPGFLVCVVCALIAAGCSSGTDATVYQTQTAASNPAAQSQPGANQPGGLIGVWDGTTRAYCGTMSLPDRCNAGEKVSLTLIHGEGDNLAGHYTCSYGNMDCLHQDETGKVVSATLNGNQITARVIMTDGLSCFYTGHRTGEKVSGGYTCYAGGSLEEQGSWQAQRSY
jgi:hypothetical protein